MIFIMNETETRTFSKLFHIGMWWRISYGFLRVFLGLALLKVIGRPLIEVATKVMEHELLGKTPDVIFTFISKILTENDFSVTYFLTFYFIFWGVVDIVLSYNVLRDNLWAFPFSLAVVGLFILYGLFRFTYTHSLVLLGIITLDFLITILIYKEYERIRAKDPASETLLQKLHSFKKSR